MRGRLTGIVLRNGIEIADPLDVTLEFLGGSSSYDAFESPASSFDEEDLRHANRGGARISAAQIFAILDRRNAIEAALRRIEPDASLAGRVPWDALVQLFDAFADIGGVGFSKITKALHRKRPALIPMLDSVVQRYLASVDGDLDVSGTFGERATALVRSYKRDLDPNVASLQEIQRELARRDHRLTEVRILDLLIWSVSV